MRIETGMYVRTNLGIGTIHRMSGNKIYDVKFKKGHIKKYVQVIAEPSFNIIDLIEEGDYVNGYLVEKSYTGDLFVISNYVGGKGFETIETYRTNIKDLICIDDVVTHEQFESMKYKIED